MSKTPEAGSARESYLSVRVLASEKRAAAVMAKMAGLSLSRWIRRLINEESLRQSVQIEEEKNDA